MQRRCPQCGAQVEVPESRLSARCAFCDSPLVDDALAQRAEIDLVVPFEIGAERAHTAIQRFLREEWLIADAVRQAGRPEELEAVFVPFWSWDAGTRSDWSAVVEVRGDRGFTENDPRGDGIEWMPLQASHITAHPDHLVSASKGLHEVEANALGIYDVSRGARFQKGLVAGITAEVPTLERAQAQEIARVELSDLARRLIERSHIPAAKWQNLQVTTQVHLGAPRLVLLPVWIAAVRSPKGPVQLLVNGQTGVVVGQIERDPWKVAALLTAVSVGVTVAIVAVVVLAAWAEGR